MIIAIINQLINQVKSNFLNVFKAVLLPFSIMFIVFWIGKSNNVEVSDLTRDTAAVLHGHPYDGMISMLGLFLWSASAAICYLTYRVIKDGSSTAKNIFLFGGALSLFLGFDDAFQLHEEVFIHAFPFAEKLFYLVYMGSIAGYFLLQWKKLFETKILFWVGAMFFFFASMVLDNVDPFVSHQVYYEDCCKFAGIFLWFVYYANTSYTELRKNNKGK
ncbi:MAG: hypothetical protein ACKOX3_02580 [Bacteroidota bacterium]